MHRTGRHKSSTTIKSNIEQHSDDFKLFKKIVYEKHITIEGTSFYVKLELMQLESDQIAASCSALISQPVASAVGEEGECEASAGGETGITPPLPTLSYYPSLQNSPPG